MRGFKSMMISGGIVTVAVPCCRAILKGNKMKHYILRSAMIFAAGALTVGAVAFFLSPQPAQAPVASGNDKFTMITVNLQEGVNLEGVFVLNHLTGVLVGGVINEQTSKFAYRYVHNVAADFKTTSKSAKYAIVTGQFNLRASGGVAPAPSVIYVGELSTGAVIAYALPRPTNQPSGTTMPLAVLDYFSFADSIGQ